MKNETRAAGQNQSEINEEKEPAGGLDTNKCCCKCRQQGQLPAKPCGKKAAVKSVVPDDNKKTTDSAEPIIQPAK